MTTRALLLAGALAAVSATAADISERRIVYSVPGMDRVRPVRDLTYRSATGDDLKMDVYPPAGLSASERRPVVFFVHGGPVPPETRPKDWGVLTRHVSIIDTYAVERRHVYTQR